MWSGGWQQWPLQQAMYQNMPHDQVDWAALAKQWIQMQHTPPPSDPNFVPPMPPQIPPPPAAIMAVEPILPTAAESFRGPLLPTLPTVEKVAIPENIIRPPIPAHPPVSSDVLLPSDIVITPSDVPAENFWSNTWDPNAPSNWPSMAPTADKGSFHYGANMHGNLPAPGYDYNHEPFAPHQQGFVQYWPGQESMPPFMRKEGKLSVDDMLLARSEEMVQMDAAKRKQLPIWIREGLEKMERDRQRQEEKERMKLAYEERRRSQREALAAEENRAENDPAALRKSRFDSDSDDEENMGQSTGKTSPSPPRNAKMSPLKALTEEELMLKMRRMLTEILLEVTNEEVIAVSKEVHQRARYKVPAQQLATSSALASITGVLGGLAGYGSDEEEEEDDERNLNGSGYEDSDVELERIIQEKKKTFAEKQLQIEEALFDAQKKEEMDNYENVAPDADLPPPNNKPVPNTQSPVVEIAQSELEILKPSDSSEIIKPEAPPKETKPVLKSASSSDSSSSPSSSSESETESDSSQSSRSRKPKSKKSEKINGKKRTSSPSVEGKGSQSSRRDSSKSNHHGDNRRSRSRDRKNSQDSSRRSNYRRDSRNFRSGSRTKLGRQSASRDRRNKDRQSRSKEKRSRSKDRQSRSRDKRSRSKDRRSRSRDKRSRSKERRSSSKDRLKRNREKERNKDRKNRSRSKDRSSLSKDRQKSSRKSRSRSKEGKGKKDENKRKRKSRSSSRDDENKTKGDGISKNRRSRSPSRSREEKKSKHNQRKSRSSSYESVRSGKKSSGKHKRR